MDGLVIPESPFVIDARKLGAPLPEPGMCRTCGGPMPPDEREPPKHCSKNHARAANKARRKGRPYEFKPGVCWCGKPAGVAPPVLYCKDECRANRKPMYGRGQLPPFRMFLRCVRYPHKLDWLAEKVGLAADDPNLPVVALGLAVEGKLYAYVTREGEVGEVGWPRRQSKPKIHTPDPELDGDG